MHPRIGILGGTFNPVHYGHLASSEEIRERLKLDRVLFIPSFIPPHKHEKDVPSAAQRMEMVHLAIRENNRFDMSEIEIKRGGTSYTVDTVEALRTEYPHGELFFITGLDSFLEIQTWHRWEHLLGLCAFVVLSRPGYRFSDLAKISFLTSSTEKLASLDGGYINEVQIHEHNLSLYLEKISHYDISSTDIRKRIREGHSIKYLLPEAVEHYIIENNLYA